MDFTLVWVNLLSVVSSGLVADKARVPTWVFTFVGRVSFATGQRIVLNIQFFFHLYPKSQLRVGRAFGFFCWALARLMRLTKPNLKYLPWTSMLSFPAK